MADDGHGGKIDGKLKDSLPVIPDRVVALLEKGQDVPLEALVSEPALEQAEEAAHKKASPVHAEDLIAVPKGHPVTQTIHDGMSVPKMPVTRRVIPAPFRRPSIHIDHHGKSWQLLPVTTVKPGDIMPDVGKVAGVSTRVRYRTRGDILGIDVAGSDLSPLDTPVAIGVDVVLTGVSGEEHLIAEGERVRVFTEAQPDAR